MTLAGNSGKSLPVHGVLAVKIIPNFGALRENEAAFDVAVASITSGDSAWGRSILVALRDHICSTGEQKSVQWLLPKGERLPPAPEALSMAMWRGYQLYSPWYLNNTIHLLSALLTILLGCCHIKRFRRASRCGEAMARRRQEDGRVGSVSRGMVRRWGRVFSRGRHRGVPDRDVIPERCHASGAAVDVCSAAPAWTQLAQPRPPLRQPWLPLCEFRQTTVRTGAE
jgi:hypothetical protein